MGESSSHLIFFTSSLIVAAGIAFLIGTNALSIAQSMQDNSKMLSERYRSSITIINDPENTFNNIYVKNTGKTSLSSELVDAFVDGVFMQMNSSIEGGLYWTEGVVLNISASLPAGTHSVRVVMENGASDTFIYKK
jgi:archaellum component FlaG (FlaF/FlaG flagellin family)